MAKWDSVSEGNRRVVPAEADGVPDAGDSADGLPPVPPPPGPAAIPVEKVVVRVFAAVAVVLLSVAVLTGVSTVRALAREVGAPGRVVGLTARTVEVPRETADPALRGGIEREFFYPVVEFELPDGTRKTVQTAEGSWPPAYEVGEAVTVLYDPGKPIDARIASVSGTLLRWTWTLITGVLGLAFTLATVLVYRVTQRRGP